MDDDIKDMQRVCGGGLRSRSEKIDFGQLGKVRVLALHFARHLNAPAAPQTRLGYCCKWVPPWGRYSFRFELRSPGYITIYSLEGF